MRFVAVHPVAFTEEQLRPLAKESLPEGVTWDSSFCGYKEDLTYCLWKAPAKEDLVAVFKRYEIPYEAIHAVRRFDPATGELEPEPVEEKVPQPV
jgi:hypothetical protein